MVVARKHKRMPFLGTPAHGHKKTSHGAKDPVQVVSKERTFADRLLAPGGRFAFIDALPPRMLANVRSAHKIVFSEDAWSVALYVAYTLPDELVQQARFAVAPYENTWIEFVLAQKRHAILATVDKVFILREDENECSVCPTVFRLNRRWSSLSERQEFLAACGNITSDELAMDTWSFAKMFENNTLTTIEKGPDPHYFYSLVDDHSYEVLGYVSQPEMSEVIRRSVGFMRVVLAVFLLLNRPAKPPVFTNVPARRGFIRNKLRPFVAHTVVTFDLDQKAPLLPLHPVKGTGSSKRHHEVRHHYAHRWRSRRCDHDYVRLAKYSAEAESDAGRHCAWRCTKCDTLRYRVKWHTRGDSLRGISVQEHEVIASRSR